MSQKICYIVLLLLLVVVVVTAVVLVFCVVFDLMSRDTGFGQVYVGTWREAPVASMSYLVNSS